MLFLGNTALDKPRPPDHARPLSPLAKPQNPIVLCLAGLLQFYRAKEGYLQGQIGNPEGEASTWFGGFQGL